MRKLVILHLLFAALTVSACDGDSSNANATVTNLCTGTGGKLQDGKCVCNGEICESAGWCDSGGKCSSDIELTPELLCVASGGVSQAEGCECSGTVCDEGLVCDLGSKKCPEKGDNCVNNNNEIVFESACKASGGAFAGGICVCNTVGCGRGVICNFNTKNCADTGIHNGDPCTGNGSECHNDVDLVGQLIACNGSTYETSECKDSSGNTLSCHGNKCGTCKNYTNQCINQVNEFSEEIGVVQECQEGVGGKPIAMCNDVSCRADIPSCGECINGKLKCTEDNDNNAIMHRCIDGKWERIRNRFDPMDPDYACPLNCTENVNIEFRIYECDRSQCDKCDPCWGEPFDEHSAPSNPNPCYDEARCAAVRAQEDDDHYPPFRDIDFTKKINDTRTLKKVHGYDWQDYTHSTKEERVHDFYLDLTNGTRRVSCKSDGSDYGRCHNSLQICINEDYHTRGYIVQCSRGELAEYPSTKCDDSNDPNCGMTKGDGIACHCERTSNNAVGCCYTRHSCFKNTTATSGPELCRKPSVDTENSGGYGESYGGYSDNPQ